MRRKLAWSMLAMAGLVTTAFALSGAGLAAQPQTLDPKNPKLEYNLGLAFQAAQVKSPDATAKAARDLGLETIGDRVRVVVEADDVASAKAAVSAAGGTVRRSAGNLVSAIVPPEALLNLAYEDGVTYVRSPFAARAEATVDEGVVASNASAWHAIGRKGAGVKVGVIDLGLADRAAAIQSGDLPADTVVQNYCSDINDTGHGTAVGHVVHSMAPDAKLYLICIDDEVDLAAAEAYAKAQGISIINHSVAWINTARGDGTGAAGTPDAIVADARNNGILWVNSAGNYQKMHWSQTFNDPDGDGLHNYSGTDEGNDFYLNGSPAPGLYYYIDLWLKWDSWPTTNQDFDLLVRDSAGNLVAQSSSAQTGSQKPREALRFLNVSNVKRTFKIEIRKWSANTSPRFDLNFFNSPAPLQYTTTAGSLADPSTSPKALAVGAICWKTSGLESFSSLGPTIDGRIKPEIAAQDANSSPIYGKFTACGNSTGFTGTSSSSPRVAGAAAIVKGLHPTWTADQLQAYLMSTAKDLGPAGMDNSYGAGRLYLPVLAPKITGYTPSSAAVGASVKINGTGLSSPNSVKFNGVTAVPTSSTPTSITVPVPSNATTGAVVVTNDDGVSTGPVFKVLPRIDTLSTDHAVRGTPVTITGDSFTGATKVTFNNVSAGAAGVGFTVTNDEHITATIPPTGTTGKIAVTTPGGTATSTASFTVVLPPTVSSISPSSAAVGSTITVKGANIGYVTAATLNGASAGSLTIDSATQLRFTLPNGATSGKIQLTNAAGSGPLSSATLKVLPRLDSFAPDHAVRGTPVTLTGDSLTGATKVTFNNVSAGAAGVGFTVTDDDHITATIPPTGTTGKIAVTTPGGTATSTASFTVVLPPTVSSISPSSAAVGSTITVKGANLGYVDDVLLNGADAGPFTIDNAGQLRFTLQNGALSGKIQLTNAAGSGPLSSATLKVLPRLDSFAPDHATRGSIVSITGDAFTGATKVTLNGVSAGAAGVGFVVTDDEHITATVPATATSGKIAVTTPSGTGTSTAIFTVVLPPTVSSISPSSAPVGSTITVKGANLGYVTAATLNGASAGSLTIDSATQLRFTLQNGATSGKLQLTNAAGPGPLSGSTLKVLPRVDSLSADHGLRGAAVTITGDAFTGATKVTLNGVSAGAAGVGFVVTDDEHITATVPATATSGKIAVTTPSGTGTSTASYTVVLKPAISSFTPSHAQQGALITINGSNLLYTTSVSFGGTAQGTIAQRISNSQIKVNVPAGAVTGKLTVTNDAGASNPSGGTFTVDPVPAPLVAVGW